MILRKTSITCFMVIFFLSVGLQPIACSQNGSGDVTNVKDFTLKDYEGKEHSLSDYKNSKAIVLIFVATECPISNAYNSRMEAIYNDYKGKDVAFLGINSNKAESVMSIKEHAEENGLTFTILKDEKNKYISCGISVNICSNRLKSSNLSRPQICDSCSWRVHINSS